MDKRPAMWQRWLGLAVICVVMTGLTAGVFVLGAAGGADMMTYLPVVAGPPPENGGGTLQNGGTVEGPDGVGIGALTDTLPAPVTVSIARTQAPTMPLPSMAQAVSQYYTIGAGQDILVEPQRPFILAFPLPPGVDTAHLALAVLRRGSEVADADPNLQAWAFLEGQVDENQNLFLTTIAGLTLEGRTYVLTSHPDFESPSNQAPAGSRPQISQIRAKCTHFTLSSDCTAATESAVTTFLLEVYGHIQTNKGFNDPRLRYLHGTLQYNPNALSSLGFMVYIEPHDYGFCDSLNAAGHYGVHNGVLALCLDPATGLTDSKYGTLVHEYFHATEGGYEPTKNDWLAGMEKDWLIEGMATAAKESYDGSDMHRTESSGWEELHKVDVSMTSEAGLDAYFAQDFWVFYGQHNSEDLSYLQSLLDTGAKSEDVASALGDGERLPAYWEWAKNQAMEKQVTFDNKLQNPCQIEQDVVQTFEIFQHHNPNKLEHQVTVGPLSTAVVRLTFSESWGFASGSVYAHLVAQLPKAEQALEYKFYEDGEAGCSSVPDGVRTWPWEEGGVHTGNVYYVLVSNTDVNETFDYTISFEFAN